LRQIRKNKLRLFETAFSGWRRRIRKRHLRQRQKGASPWVPPVAVRARKSLLSPLITVFLSPYLSIARRRRPNGPSSRTSQDEGCDDKHHQDFLETPAAAKQRGKFLSKN